MSVTQRDTFFLRRARVPRARIALDVAGGDHLLARHFMRIDMDIARSFTAKQREAIVSMLDDRAGDHHWINFRHSLPFGSERIYLALLVGRERRSFDRLMGERMLSPLRTLFVYGMGALLLFMFLLSLHTVIELTTGVELVWDGLLPAFLEALQTQGRALLDWVSRLASG